MVRKLIITKFRGDLHYLFLKFPRTEVIREAINSMRFAEVELNNKKIFIKSSNTELANKILRNLKIPPPANMTSAENLTF